MGRKFTDNEVARIAELARKGLAPKLIAERLGLPLPAGADRVRRAIKREEAREKLRQVGRDLFGSQTPNKPA